MRLSRLDYTIYAVIAVIAMAGSLVVRPKSMTWLLPTVVILGLAAIGCNWLIEKLRNEEPSEMRTRSALFSVGAIISTLTSIIAMQVGGPTKRVATAPPSNSSNETRMENASIFDEQGNYTFGYRSIDRISEKEYETLDEELINTGVRYAMLVDVWLSIRQTREILHTLRPGPEIARSVQYALRDLETSIKHYTKDKSLMMESVLLHVKQSTQDSAVLALINKNEKTLRRFYQKLDHELTERQQTLREQAAILIEMASFPDRWVVTSNHADLRTDRDQLRWNATIAKAFGALNALENGYPLYLGYRIFLTRINRLTD